MRQDAKRKNLEEYLFGDLELPHDPPSLTHLATIVVRRRRLMQSDQTPTTLVPLPTR